MDFSIPEEYKRLQNALGQFIEREVLPTVDTAPRDEYGEIDTETSRRIRQRSVELGFYNIAMSEEYGGLGVGTLATIILEEELYRRMPGFPEGWGVYILSNFAYSPLGELINSSEDMKEKYLWPVIRGEKLSFFGLTEPEAGSDAQNIQTRAVRSGDDFIINGRKVFISSAYRAAFGLVFAVTDPEKRARGGITAFLVDKGTPGFQIERRIRTMGGYYIDQLLFEDCAVPVKNVLGEIGRGFYLGVDRLNHARVSAAAHCLGSAEWCFKMATSYSKQRVTFGKPIADRQAIQWMLTDTAVELDAARLLTYRACWQIDQGKDPRLEAAMAKLYASEMADRAADRAIQIHGGIGYTTDVPLESIYRQLRVYRIAPGTSEIMRRLIARDVLRD